MDFLLELDARIFLFFNSFHTPLLDTFMPLFSGRFTWVPLYLALIVYLLRTYGGKTTLVFVLAIALAVTVSDQVCASIIRPAVERLRPSNLDNPLSLVTIVVDGYRGGAYGFPSCHAANSFALATTLAILVRRPKLTAFLFSWAIVNCYSRLYLGVHYPGDLLVGGAIGAMSACLICMAVCRLWSKKKRETHVPARPLTLHFPIKLASVGVKEMTIGITASDLVIATGLTTVLLMLLASI